MPQNISMCVRQRVPSTQNMKTPVAPVPSVLPAPAMQAPSVNQQGPASAAVPPVLPSPAVQMPSVGAAGPAAQPVTASHPMVAGLNNQVNQIVSHVQGAQNASPALLFELGNLSNSINQIAMGAAAAFEALHMANGNPGAQNAISHLKDASNNLKASL